MGAIFVDADSWVCLNEMRLLFEKLVGKVIEFFIQFILSCLSKNKTLLIYSCV